MYLCFHLLMFFNGHIDRKYSRCHEITRCGKRQKNSHRNLKKVGCELEPKVDGENGRMPLKSSVGTRSLPPSSQASRMLAGSGRRSRHNGQAKKLLQCAPASTDTHVCGSQDMSLFKSGGQFFSQ